MNGIYGDMLLYFPEQIESITAYKMTAIINAGYTVDEKSKISVKGILHNTQGSRIKDSNGNLVTSIALELWTQEKLEGYYTTIDDTVYHINASSNWMKQGGFYKYTLEKVIGNNGTQSEIDTWNTGADSFS